MLQKIAKLLDVKSIVTIALTVAYIMLSLHGEISTEQFQSVFVTVIAFYFGTQYQKNGGYHD